mgnify:FL=1
MPSWKIHRYFANKIGIRPEISERVDRIIDLENEFKGYKIGHDWVKGNMGRFVLATELFYEEFGIDGVKAMLMHGALDYIDQLLKRNFPRNEILWRALAWVKFCGARHVIRYISHLSDSERLKWVEKQEFNYYEYLKIRGTAVEEIVKAAREVISFIAQNFDEILEMIKTNTK